MTAIEQIHNIAAKLNCWSQKEVLMKDYTSFKIGGPADLFVKPNSLAKAAELLKESRLLGVQTFIIGKGSNLLVSDVGIRGLVICTTELNNCEIFNEEEILCSAGVNLASLCNFALEHDLEGLEFAFGIPGSAGGAAFMNAGAYGGEMKDVLISCNHITPQAAFESLEGDAMELGYRQSAYTLNGCLIAEIRLKLRKGNNAEIKKKMVELLGKRKDKQPLEYPSAGSTFKRPEGYYAGALIEECGLKGKTVGGAMVSEKHAGFVINKGGATANDVLKLIDLIKETIFVQKGVVLETEIKFI